MGQADIAYMIQRIYEKYNATQKDKKHEERVYMREEEFKANLEEMVKKSPIEDKSLLYSEIYRNISEDALEVDSKGTITISLKVIIEAEKEIQKKEKNQIQEVPQKEEIAPIKIISKEEYNKLSNEEKRDRFVEATGWVWESPEEAKEAFDELSKYSFSTDTEALVKAKEELQSGKGVSKNTFEQTTGIKYSDNKKYQRLILLNEAKIAEMSKKTCFSMFFNVNGDQNELNMQMLEDFLMILDSNRTPGQKKIQLNDLFEKGLITEEQYKSVALILSQKDVSENYGKLVKMLKEHATVKNFAKYVSSNTTTIEQYEELVASFTELFDDNTISEFNANLDNLIGTLEQGKTMSKHDLDRINSTFNSFHNSNMRAIAIVKGKMPSFKIETQAKYDENDISILKNKINGRTASFDIDAYDIKKTENILYDDGVKEDKIKKDLASTGKSFFSQEELARVVRKGMESNSYEAFEKNGIDEKSFQDLSTPLNSSGDKFVVETFDELEANFEESLAAIGDGGDDMFAAIFGDMAEEMIVEGEPELEVETDRTPEGESVDDILINVTPSSGIVVEDVALEDIVSKINEAPVSSGTTEIEEEEIIPTQEEPGMLAVDTFANKIKRGLNELGKKVKGMFGKIASMFGGNNDAGNNTSTTSTGGQTQEAKSPKATQTPENGFIQHVDLKFDFLKNANTEGRTDETKPKGVDESTQGYEMDD